MHVGILGAGALAASLTARWRATGHRVFTASPSDSDLATADAAVSLLEDTVLRAHVAFLVLSLPRALSLPHKPFIGRIVVDSTAFYVWPEGTYPDIDAGRTTSGELLADHLPGAAVVQVLNPADLLALGESGPLGGSVPRPSILAAGDETSAVIAVTDLISDLGLDVVYTGPLQAARRQRDGVPAAPRINPEDPRIRMTDA
jgi:predicted dinucleotide-binding enzyme